MINLFDAHLPGSGLPRRLRFATALLIAAGACLASLPAAHAGKSVLIHSPPQVVVIGGVSVGFEARMEFCADQHRGFGFVTFMTEEEVVQFYPFWGDVDRKTGAVMLFLSPRSDGPIGPGEIITLVVQDSPLGIEDCDIFVLVGSGIGGGTSLDEPFEAETRITRSNHRGNCAPRDFGQIDALVDVDVPIQRVEPPPPPSEIIGFGTRLRLDRNQEAQGYLKVYTSSETRTYEPLFGAAFRDESGEVEFFVFSLLDSRRGFLSSNDHAMRATGGTTANDPDCLIWDLINGTSGEANGMFDVEGTLKLRGPARGRNVGVKP